MADALRAKPAELKLSEQEIVDGIRGRGRAASRKGGMDGPGCVLSANAGKGTEWIGQEWRDFSCRDLEGHLWNIGTYDPW